MAEMIKQLEAESELSKQLLGNFQTESSCDHKQLEAKVKVDLLIKRRVLQSQN